MHGLTAYALNSSEPGLLLGAVANCTTFLVAQPLFHRGLTPAAAVHALVLGSLIFGAFGARAWILVALYFLSGTAATRLRLPQKQSEGIAEAHGGHRSADAVWGSGIAGALCAIASLLGVPGLDWRLGFVASFASKLADTLSSEVGKAYGTSTYLSTTLARVPRGTEGGVSLEGSVAGVVAAVAFACIAHALGLVDAPGKGIVIVSAVVANTAESVAGASVQGHLRWLTNSRLNALQVTLAAVLALAIRRAAMSV